MGRRIFLGVVLAILLLLVQPLLSPGVFASGNLKTLGLTITDEVLIRTEPERKGEIICKLPFASPLYTHRLPYNLRKDYYKVVLEDGQVGWISRKNLHIPWGVWEYQGREDDIWLYITTARQLARSSSGDNHSIARRLLNMLKDYPDQRIKFHDTDVGGVFYESLRVEVYRSLAFIEENPEKAVKYLEKMIQQELATAQDKAEATEKIIELYREELKNFEKADQVTHQLIANYSNLEVVGYEWNYWYDIEVAYDLLNFYLKEEPNTERLLTESQKIIYETSNGAVYHIGASGKAAALIQLGQFEKAYQTVLKALRKYPKEIREYYKEEENYSLFSMGYALKEFEKEGRYREGASFASRIRENVHNQEVLSFASFWIAQLMDQGAGDRDQVIRLYELAYWNRTYPNFIDYFYTRNRQDKIEEFMPGVGEISSADTEFTPGLSSISSRHLKKRTRVQLLYQMIIKEQNKVKKLMKVEVDDQIGWVQADTIEKISSYSPKYRHSLENNIKNSDKYNLIDDFHNTIGIFERNSKFGYLTIAGEVIVAPQYYGASQMYDDRGLVLTKPYNHGLNNMGDYILINHQGQKVSSYLDTISSPYKLSAKGQVGERFIVVCRSGLSLRKGPGTDTERLTVIRPTDELVLLDNLSDSQPFKYDGIKGYWAHVRYKEREVYVFSGYLSKLPNPWVGWEGNVYESMIPTKNTLEKDLGQLLVGEGSLKCNQHDEDYPIHYAG